MASYTEYKHLEKPLSTEKYNVGVFIKNTDIIDTELHKLELKNADQDTLFASKEIGRASCRERVLVTE